jgi:hypothetical protein
MQILIQNLVRKTILPFNRKCQPRDLESSRGHIEVSGSLCDVKPCERLFRGNEVYSKGLKFR